MHRHRMMLAVGLVLAGSAPRGLYGQAGMETTAVRATVREAYLDDLTTVERKYLSLATAFSAEQFEWRPAKGVRSVREVVELIIAENGVALPAALGRPAVTGLPGDFPGAIRTLAEKHLPRSELLAALGESFRHLRRCWEETAESEMGIERPFFGTRRTAEQIAWSAVADQHEHLGQLIAYARLNGVVPPWSRPN